MNRPGLVRPAVRATVDVALDRFGGLRAELRTFTGLPDPGEHVALTVRGPGDPSGTPLVRMHSECLTGDVFGSARCDCGPQLEESMTRLAGSGGVLLYLRQEGRGIGLYNKVDAYVLQDRGYDTFAANRALGMPADSRDYRVAAAMLTTLGYPRVRLLTNNPDKVTQLRAHGIDVAETIPTGVHATDDNVEYLRAKSDQARHTLELGCGK